MSQTTTNTLIVDDTNLHLVTAMADNAKPKTTRGKRPKKTSLVATAAAAALAVTAPGKVASKFPTSLEDFEDLINDKIQTVAAFTDAIKTKFANDFRWQIKLNDILEANDVVDSKKVLSSVSSEYLLYLCLTGWTQPCLRDSSYRSDLRVEFHRIQNVGPDEKPIAGKKALYETLTYNPSADEFTYIISGSSEFRDYDEFVFSGRELLNNL